MAYIVIQGSKGFVSLVEKARMEQADGSSKVQTIRGICGLGVMTKEEYLKYQSWAHSFKDQEERKAMVLSSGRAIAVKEKAVKAVVADKQAKTIVKKSPIVKQVISKDEKEKKRIRKHKEWFSTLTEKQREEYKERHIKDLLEDQKELQERFKKIERKKYVKGQTMYKIEDLTKAQQYEAEIKTLKGDNAKQSLIIEREKKIKNILGNRYKSCREIAVAGDKGDISII